MPKVSINILTKNRAEFLDVALKSVSNQTYDDYELIIVNDGSVDNTIEILDKWKHLNLKIITHQNSLGITKSRQEALESSQGKYVAILDDDDFWQDINKLKKQVEFLEEKPDYSLIGGGMLISGLILKLRPQSDEQIRNSMLFKNNFFTSSILFKKEDAIKVGGFKKDDLDLAEDYDLWLRLGKIGKMYNFQEPFVNYRAPRYNKVKLKQFFIKQKSLIKREKNNYPGYFIANLILSLRLLFK